MDREAACRVKRVELGQKLEKYDPNLRAERMGAKRGLRCELRVQ